ncbi:MAG: hypothetical protein ACI86S_002399 [Paracoccaceae bacterium]|jgi:hypothetical protein
MTTGARVPRRPTRHPEAFGESVFEQKNVGAI